MSNPNPKNLTKFLSEKCRTLTQKIEQNFAPKNFERTIFYTKKYGQKYFHPNFWSRKKNWLAKNISPKSETDENAFIQNEQLITICLAALGVTSTGLLMWIAIQHLYGIYTDFKKTINPMSYHDSNYRKVFLNYVFVSMEIIGGIINIFKHIFNIKKLKKKQNSLNFEKKSLKKKLGKKVPK